MGERLDRQSASMSYFTGLLMAYQKIIPSKTPPDGATGSITTSKSKDISWNWLVLFLLNTSQVKIKYKFSKPFCSKRFSNGGNHAESEQCLWPFNYTQNNFKTIIQESTFFLFNHFNF